MLCSLDSSSRTHVRADTGNPRGPVITLGLDCHRAMRALPSPGKQKALSLTALSVSRSCVISPSFGTVTMQCSRAVAGTCYFRPSEVRRCTLRHRVFRACLRPTASLERCVDWGGATGIGITVQSMNNNRCALQSFPGQRALSEALGAAGAMRASGPCCRLISICAAAARAAQQMRRGSSARSAACQSLPGEGLKFHRHSSVRAGSGRTSPTSDRIKPADGEELTRCSSGSGVCTHSG
jgi:hypothetical protein